MSSGSEPETATVCPLKYVDVEEELFSRCAYNLFLGLLEVDKDEPNRHSFAFAMDERGEGVLWVFEDHPREEWRYCGKVRVKGPAKELDALAVLKLATLRAYLSFLEVAVGVPPEKWAEAERLLESAGDDDIGVRDEGIVEACEGKPVCLDLARSEEDVVVVRTPYGDIEVSYQFKRSCPKPCYVSGEMWLDGIVKWGAAVSLSLLIASHSLSSSRSRA